MKYTNFDYNGGFPFDQSTLKRLQDAVFEHIRTYARQLGCQDVGNYVLFGCEISGANITPGAMFIDGEVCPFAGAVGTLATKIMKQTTTANAPFENGTNPPVFIETIAVVNAAGTALSEFQRFLNFLQADKTKLDGIEAGAEKNVQTDWDIVNTLSDGYLKNRPTNLVKYKSALGTSYTMFGNNSYTWLITHNLGNTNYNVVTEVELIDEIENAANIPVYSVTIHEKTENSFRVKTHQTNAVPAAGMKVHIKILF